MTTNWKKIEINKKVFILRKIYIFAPENKV